MPRRRLNRNDDSDVAEEPPRRSTQANDEMEVMQASTRRATRMYTSNVSGGSQPSARRSAETNDDSNIGQATRRGRRNQNNDYEGSQPPARRSAIDQSSRQSSRLNRGADDRQDLAGGQAPPQRATKKKNRAPSPESDDDDIIMDVSGGNNQAYNDEDDDEDVAARFKKEKSNAMFRYFLIAVPSKKFVKRADLIKHCMGNEQANLFKEIYEITNRKLEHFCGVSLHEHPQKKDLYYLVNNLPKMDFLQLSRGQSSNQFESAADGLLYTILSAIYMKTPDAKELPEPVLGAFLRKIGVNLGDSHSKVHPRHAVYGDVKKLVKRFVEEGWLLIRKTRSAVGDDEFVYAWGWRSLAHLRRVDMFNWVCDVFTNGSGGNFNPHQWDHILEKAQREDEELGNA